MQQCINLGVLGINFLLLPFGLPSLLAQRALWRPYWKRLIVLALLGVTAFNSLVYIGLQSTGATNAVLLNSFIPILIAALGALLACAGVALEPGEFRRFGSARRLYHFHVDNADAY